MGLNEIILSNQLVADLYGHVLLDSNASENQNTSTSSPTVLIITDRNANDVAETEPFLSGILNACKIRPVDAKILDHVSFDQEPLDMIVEKHGSSFVLVFGLSPDVTETHDRDTPCTLPHKNAKIVLAPSLSALQSDRDKKRQLWELLKKLFEIS